MYSWEIYISMKISKTTRQNKVHMLFWTKEKEYRGLDILSKLSKAVYR